MEETQEGLKRKQHRQWRELTMSRRTPQEIIDETKLLRNEGWTLKMIAEKFSVSITTVTKRLEDYGRPPKEPKAKAPKAPKEKVPKKKKTSLKLIRATLPEDFYWDTFLGATDEELARKYKITPQEANKAAKKERNAKFQIGCATKSKIWKMRRSGYNKKEVAEFLKLSTDIVSENWNNYDNDDPEERLRSYDNNGRHVSWFRSKNDKG